ncbi:MAG: hypothetical protein V7785_23520 [Bermanella sp.]
MPNIIKKEDIIISIGEYKEKGETKQRLKVIGELITLCADNGSEYQYGELWGPTGSTQFNLLAQEHSSPEIQTPQVKPAEPEPEPGYYFANGSVMSSQEASHYRDRGIAPWNMGTAPPDFN